MTSFDRSIEATAAATRMVKAFGITAEQAAIAFARLGDAAKRLRNEDKALRAAIRAKKPWYRHSRW